MLRDQSLVYLSAARLHSESLLVAAPFLHLVGCIHNMQKLVMVV